MSLKELCQIDTKTGEIKKELITVENQRILRDLMRKKGIDKSSQGGKNLSYRQYCKLFESMKFRGKCCPQGLDKCDKSEQGPCCQAVTEDGTRCERKASRITAYDLTQKQFNIKGKIPAFLKKKLGVRKVEKLQLAGMGIKCCFLCWQHAAIYTAELLTWSSNVLYYSSHPEDLLGIFYRQVAVQKFLKLFTYDFKVSELKSVNDIVDAAFKTKATMAGKLSAYSFTYWGIVFAFYAYDKLVEMLKKHMGDAKLAENTAKQMSERAADVLLAM